MKLKNIFEDNNYRPFKDGQDGVVVFSGDEWYGVTGVKSFDMIQNAIDSVQGDDGEFLDTMFSNEPDVADPLKDSPYSSEYKGEAIPVTLKQFVAMLIADARRMYSE